MTLSELKQIKKDVSNGVLISKETWLKVLDAAISFRDDLGPIGQVKAGKDCNDNPENDIWLIDGSNSAERFADLLLPGTIVFAPRATLHRVTK